MVAQNSAEFHFFRRRARQLGRCLSALAQSLVITAIPFIKNYIFYAVSAAKWSGADWIQVAAPEFGDIISGYEKNFKTFAKMWEWKQFENN